MEERTCTFITAYIYDKTKISKENVRVDNYLLLNIADGNVPYVSHVGQITYKINTKFLNLKRVLDLHCK